ncbi:hypothetical protein [Humibacillus xanthopallidus]|uniref:hypothetical protein n=1 Tax=Humibacillus xanthopallidus TaxID=412689 RepID=UPI00384EE150
MNDIERRVAQGLRAYGEGLVMTTEEIDQLERGLETKQKASRKELRHRIWQGAVAACAVTGVVLGALALRSDPAPPNVPADSPALTTTELAGIWSFDSWLWTFHSDGRLTQTQDPYDPEAHHSDDAVTYAPAPGGFIERIASAGAVCDITWAATISPEGLLRATPTTESSAGCGAAAPTDSSAPAEMWEFTRVSPVSVAGANLALLWPTAAPEPVSDLSKVRGTWLLRGTDKVLSIDDSGRYAVRTFDSLDQPEQAGRATVTGPGSLVFTPASGPTCTAHYEPVTSLNSTMEATLAAGSCWRLGGGNDTWIRIN